jgi:proton-translocating NADH-quinone oxidoreductase chain N
MVSPVLPLAILGAGAGVSFVLGRAFRGRGADAASAAALVALAGAFATFVAMYDFTPVAEYPYGEEVLRADGLAVLLGLIATGLGFAVTAYTIVHMRGDREADRPLYTALFLLLVLGVAGLGLAGDLFNLYVFFELMAISSYALVAYYRLRTDAVEAGMKYLVMNGAGSLLALIGIGIVYLSSPNGSLDLQTLARTTLNGSPTSAYLAAGFLIAGFGVKAAIVPLHTWLPDAYTAAPIGITAMLGGVVTQSGLIAMVRTLSVLGVGSASIAASYGVLLGFLAVLTMTVGNLTAMHQRDLKRMLAYSSIAQAGYVLLGFAAGLQWGTIAILGVVGALFHIVNHALMKGGAFLAAGALEDAYGTRDLDDLKGAGRRSPLLGVAFGVFVLGLAGVPPTAGFLSKLFIASGAAEGGALGAFFVVALIANSILSLAYYVPALTGLWSKEAPVAGERRVRVPLVAVVVVFAALVIGFGLWPGLVGYLYPAATGLLGGR